MPQNRVIGKPIDGQPQEVDQFPGRRGCLVDPAGTEQGVGHLEAGRDIVEPHQPCRPCAGVETSILDAWGGADVDMRLGDVGGGRLPAERSPAVEPLVGRQVDRPATLVKPLAGEQLGPKAERVRCRRCLSGARSPRSSTANVSTYPPTTACLPSGVTATLQGLPFDRHRWRDRLAGPPVPDAGGPIVARREHPAPVRREGRGDGVLGVLERRAGQPAGPPVPDPDRAIAAGRHEQPPVGAETGRVHAVRMRGQLGDDRPVAKSRTRTEPSYEASTMSRPSGENWRSWHLSRWLMGG